MAVLQPRCREIRNSPMLNQTARYNSAAIT